MNIGKDNILRTYNPYKKIVYKGAIYHIIQRAPGKDILFVEENDYLYFLHLLKEIQKEFSFSVYCFCLMPNHLHILMKINELNLSLGMKSLFTKYAIYFNTKYKRKGHVFYGNYRAFLCSDDRYLIAASVYIHLNPYKANLVNDPMDYKWSSISAYYSLPTRTFLDYKYVLNILSNNIKKASLSYMDIVRQGKPLDFKSVIEDSRFLGKFSLVFLDKIRDFFSGQDKNTYDYDIQRYFEQVKNKKRLKDPEDIKARKYLIEQLKSRGYTIKDIASMLSLSRQSIYDALEA